MAFQSLDLDIDLICDVRIMSQLEAYAGQRIHEENRNKTGVGVKLSRPMIQTGAEAAVRGDPAGLGVILHIVRVIACNDNTGTGIAHNICPRIHNCGIVGVYQHVAHVQIEGSFDTDGGGSSFKFFFANFCQLLRLNDNMTLISVGNMTGGDLCPPASHICGA